jgi:hypothetical protein
MGNSYFDDYRMGSSDYPKTSDVQSLRGMGVITLDEKVSGLGIVSLDENGKVNVEKTNKHRLGLVGKEKLTPTLSFKGVTHYRGVSSDSSGIISIQYKKYMVPEKFTALFDDEKVSCDCAQEYLGVDTDGLHKLVAEGSVVRVRNQYFLKSLNEFKAKRQYN